MRTLRKNQIKFKGIRKRIYSGKKFSIYMNIRFNNDNNHYIYYSICENGQSIDITTFLALQDAVYYYNTIANHPKPNNSL